MFVSFYYIDENYINFLQSKELEQRGFTRVPNVIYANKEKFVFGVVMEVQTEEQVIPYFVPVTSYSKSQSDNIVIKVKHDKKLTNVGSLRFNYMFPVPLRCTTRVDFKDKRFSSEYRTLLEQEYRYIKKTIRINNIQKQAHKTYENVTSKKDENLIRNSCDFKLLETAYKEYLTDNTSG